MSYPHSIAVALLAMVAPSLLGAQAVPCHASLEPVTLVGDARFRLSQLRRVIGGHGDMLDDAVRCLPAAAGSSQAFQVRAVWPEIRGSWNGALPDPGGEPGMWAGRGTNTLLSGGILVDYFHLHAALVPEGSRAQNAAFEILPSDNPARSSFASPFYDGDVSMDLPLRMGADPIAQLGMGQSALWLTGGHLGAGWSASNQRWGPGLDGLVLGRNSSGIPRLFVRTETPVPTRVGEWSGAWFVGRLTESRFFDRDTSNDARYLSAVSLAWSPPGAPALAVGAVHAVMGRLESGSATARYGPAAFAGSAAGDADEMTSLSVRVHVPSGGARAWVEVAHQGPLKLRELATAPLAGLGYRFGAERAVERTSGAWIFLTEVANVEQSQDILDRPVHDFYAGSAAIQGWTQRGQLLGDAIGPGGQSQFLSGHWVAPRWRMGAYAERLRRNEDALFRQYLPYANRHDVELHGGLQAGYSAHGYELLLDASAGKRLNYLFQNTDFIPNFRTVDVPLQQLRVTITPHLRH